MRTKLSRLAAAATLAVGATAGTVAATAGPAAALPTNCTINEYTGYHGSLHAACYGGSGQFRVSILCGSSPSSPNFRKLDKWWDVNNVSVQYCNDSFAPYYLSGTVLYR
jgi:hypothetical protein